MLAAGFDQVTPVHACGLAWALGSLVAAASSSEEPLPRDCRRKARALLPMLLHALEWDHQPDDLKVSSAARELAVVHALGTTAALCALLPLSMYQGLARRLNHKHGP